MATKEMLQSFIVCWGFWKGGGGGMNLTIAKVFLYIKISIKNEIKCIYSYIVLIFLFQKHNDFSILTIGKA